MGGLGHGDPDKVRAAYLRMDRQKEIREMLDAWAKYLTNPKSVVKLRRARR